MCLGHGEFIRSEFTDKAVNSLVNYLKDCNITDGFFNLDGYTNYKDFLTLIEINWRLVWLLLTWMIIAALVCIKN